MQAPTHGPQDLVERAEHALATLQPELAVKFYERALEATPDATAVMDALAELLIGLGESERAKGLLERSAKLAPESGPSKWLYLGQMSTGWQALQHFSKGAELLKAELSARRRVGMEAGEDVDNETYAIMNQVVSAQCSIAELYLTDLCFEDDAEGRCQVALDEAMRMDVGGSPEVTQALANLRLSQENGEEAADLMLETVRRLNACQQEDYEEDIEDEGEKGREGERGLPLPNLMFRVQTAKLLLECQTFKTGKKCAKRAIKILEACKCEDDENMEVWYLLGVAYFTQRRPDLVMARAHLEYAQGEMRKRQQLNGGAGKNEADSDYGDHLRLVEEQLAMVVDAEEKGIKKCKEDGAAMEDDGDGHEERGVISSSSSSSSSEDSCSGSDADEGGGAMEN